MQSWLQQTLIARGRCSFYSDCKTNMFQRRQGRWFLAAASKADGYRTRKCGEGGGMGRDCSKIAEKRAHLYGQCPRQHQIVSVETAIAAWWKYSFFYLIALFCWTGEWRSPSFVIPRKAASRLEETKLVHLGRGGGAEGQSSKAGCCFTESVAESSPCDQRCVLSQCGGRTPGSEGGRETSGAWEATLTKCVAVGDARLEFRYSFLFCLMQTMGLQFWEWAPIRPSLPKERDN